MNSWSSIPLNPKSVCNKLIDLTQLIPRNWANRSAATVANDAWCGRNGYEAQPAPGLGPDATRR